MSENKKDTAPDLPVIPPLPPGFPNPDPNPPVAQCGECGLVLHRFMGYCCPNVRCPCGLGPVWS